MPYLGIAQQHRRDAEEPWNPPTALLPKEAKEFHRRETGDDVLARVSWQSRQIAPLVGRKGGAALDAALVSGRLWWGDRVPPVPLRRGDPIDVRLGWKITMDQHVPTVDLPEAHHQLLRLVPSFVLDPSARELCAAEAGGAASRMTRGSEDPGSTPRSSRMSRPSCRRDSPSLALAIGSSCARGSARSARCAAIRAS